MNWPDFLSNPVASIAQGIQNGINSPSASAAPQAPAVIPASPYPVDSWGNPLYNVPPPNHGITAALAPALNQYSPTPQAPYDPFNGWNAQTTNPGTAALANPTPAAPKPQASMANPAPVSPWQGQYTGGVGSGWGGLVGNQWETGHAGGPWSVRSGTGPSSAAAAPGTSAQTAWTPNGSGQYTRPA